MNREVNFLWGRRGVWSRVGVGVGGGWWGGQGGCERRIEVFAKIPKKKHFFLGGGSGRGWGGGWGKVGGGGGVRVDVNEELKFL